MVFWVRQAIALSVGIAAGMLKFTGVYVFLAFFAALYLLSYIYYSKWLNLDEDEFQQNELFMEGIPPAVGLFLLSWTLNYTFV
jgi:hypothetical protein